MAAVAALAAAAACSSLTENDDGVASLEVRLPANLYLEKDVPLTLRAVARDRSGDTVAAVLVWRSPDTTVALDESTGRLLALFESGTAQVQVAVLGQDTIASSLTGLSFTLTARADSLLLAGPDSLTVPTDDQASPALGVRLVRGATPTGVSGRPIGFRIVEPAAADSPAVVLSRGRTADSVLSTTTGGPSTPLTVRAVTGRRPPDRVVVEVTAFRATGDPIPGSGRRIVIRFLHQ